MRLHTFDFNKIPKKAYPWLLLSILLASTLVVYAADRLVFFPAAAWAAAGKIGLSISVLLITGGFSLALGWFYYRLFTDIVVYLVQRQVHSSEKLGENPVPETSSPDISSKNWHQVLAKERLLVAMTAVVLFTLPTFLMLRVLERLLLILLTLR